MLIAYRLCSLEVCKREICFCGLSSTLIQDYGHADFLLS